MRLTDLQWNIDRVLQETPLSLQDRNKVMLRIRAEIEKFGVSLIASVGANDDRKVGS